MRSSHQGFSLVKDTHSDQPFHSLYTLSVCGMHKCRFPEAVQDSVQERIAMGHVARRAHLCKLSPTNTTKDKLLSMQRG